MNKLLIALPILALLSIGAVFMIANHKKAQSEEVAPQEDNGVVTIDSWQQCYQRLPLRICDQLTNADELQACYGASYANSQFVWDGASDELNACKSYYTYFKQSQSGDVLNKNSSYENCFLNSQAEAAAKTSDFFFNQIYKPKFITCAGF